MEVVRDIGEVLRLLWPALTVIVTVLVAALMYWARKVVVLREELYGSDGRRIYCTRQDLDGMGARIERIKRYGDTVEKVATSAEQRALANERKLEVRDERDRQMLERFNATQAEMARDLKEMAQIMSDIRDRVSRMEGAR